ncbi:hypothetical protein [Cytophaga sp. FL35]|uniref:hypothetical protein n=1 Tax=Cytophaga sp. FL35 TaxID=1904456 RepID=UPI0016538DAA|nr:hypothetical protein [Cytophaga sp. FL35]MBC6999652.1 hypothetical protein [Cytophaga sp. FL35]
MKITNTEALSNNTNVLYFNEPHSYSNAHGSFLTYNFQLEGKYNNLLRTIYPIENNGNFGKIVHINLEKKKDYKTNKNRLQGTIFFQQVK